MYPFRYTISFRIYHPIIDPEKICNTLKLETKNKWKAGEKRTTITGDPLEGVYNNSYCSFRLESSRELELSDSLRYYNKKLAKHKEFFNYIRETGGRLEYFIAWFADNDSGETFDLKLLNQMTKLEIDLTICVYPQH